MKNFALIGLGGIASRHRAAIKDNEGYLAAACDIDIKKRIDWESYRGICYLVSDYKMVDSMREINWVSICTPNDLHYEMAKYFADNGYKVICEKPFVLKPEQCDTFDNNVFVVHQLRFDDDLKRLKKRLADIKFNHYAKMVISIHRGQEYWNSWKGQIERSGGLLFNIGVHYIDLLCWLFGEMKDYDFTGNHRQCAGTLKFEKVTADFTLSLEAEKDNQKRYLIINGLEEINLARNLESLHSKVYKEALEGKGIHPKDIKYTLEVIKELSQKLGD